MFPKKMITSETTDTQNPKPVIDPKETKEKALAAALRANLKKRKSQIKKRQNQS